MPKGIPKKGYRRTKKLEIPDIKEVERRLTLRYPEFLERIEELSKPIFCPNCNTLVKVPDREALIYLCDRAVGKPVQKHELDITETIQLTGDQIDKLIERYQIVQRALLPEGKTTNFGSVYGQIEGEVKEIN